MRNVVQIDYITFSCIFLQRMRNSKGSDEFRSKFDSPTPDYSAYQISSHLVHKQGHYGEIFNFWQICKKMLGRVITPLWCLKAPSPATKKMDFQNLHKIWTWKPFSNLLASMVG